MINVLFMISYMYIYIYIIIYIYIYIHIIYQLSTFSLLDGFYPYPIHPSRDHIPRGTLRSALRSQAAGCFFLNE